jgi:hypothetical protein
MDRPGALEASRALWNRNELRLDSDEVLAQVLDRGEMESWRELYHLARNDGALRARIVRIVRSTPLPMPFFWLALLASLGEPVSFEWKLPRYADSGI